jgi:hypothetical protein
MHSGKEMMVGIAAVPCAASDEFSKARTWISTCAVRECEATLQAALCNMRLFTLIRQGQRLRGCVGSLTAAERPLHT